MKFSIEDYEVIVRVLDREAERIESTDSEHETETPEQVREALSAVETIGTY
jgi:hypothetical protein